MQNMNLFDMIEAICDNIKLRFPANPIYIMQMPQGFKRPSFYVNLVGFSDRDLCKNGLRRKVIFDVVYFAGQDAKGIVNTVQQFTAYQRLIQIFQGQSLQVKDRYLKITGVDGSPRDAEVYLTISFEYTFTPDVFEDLDPEENIEIMNQLLLKYQ